IVVVCPAPASQAAEQSLVCGPGACIRSLLLRHSAHWRARRVRSLSPASGQLHIEVLPAGWDNWVLSDVVPSGTKIISTPHGTGPLLVRSFPGPEILRSVDPPPG